jgi:glycosyltransferase involved in cell wall biosynthesis
MSYSQNPEQKRIVDEFYNGSSILLSPSLTEGFPLPPAEAAACGCALVATDIAGHREYIQDKVTGLLSPPQDPDALARNLCLLLGNEYLRIRLAQSAHDFIQQFNWQRSADLLEEFIMPAVPRCSASNPSTAPVEVSPA